MPAVAVNKVLKDLSASIHYLNEYLKKIDMPGSVTFLSSLTSDQSSDQGTEQLGKSRRDTSEVHVEVPQTAASLIGNCGNSSY